MKNNIEILLYNFNRDTCSISPSKYDN